MFYSYNFSIFKIRYKLNMKIVHINIFTMVYVNTVNTVSIFIRKKSLKYSLNSYFIQSLYIIIIINKPIKQMGSRHSNNANELFNVDQWEQIPLVKYTKNTDPYYSSNFVVLAHKKRRNVEVQRYDLFFNGPAQYISYYQSYQWRRMNSCIVSAKHLKEVSRKDFCSTFYCAVIFIQRIPIRLYEIIDIPLEEGIYLLRSALEGFHSIFEKTGYFQVESDLICINKQGKVKVWANKNLSKNYPEFSSINHNKNESDFIKKILDVIEQSIDFDNTIQFSQYAKNTLNTIKFTNIFNLITQYTQKYNIKVYRQMKSILQLYQESSKLLFTKTKKSLSHVSLEQQPTTAKRKTQSYSNMKSMQKNLNLLISQRQPHQSKKQVFRFFQKQPQNLSHTLPQVSNSFHILQQLQIRKPIPVFFRYNPMLISPQNRTTKIETIRNRELFRKIKTKKVEIKQTIQPQIIKKRKSTLNEGIYTYFTLSNTCQLDPQIAKDLQQISYL